MEKAINLINRVAKVKSSDQLVIFVLTGCSFLKLNACCIILLHTAALVDSTLNLRKGAAGKVGYVYACTDGGAPWTDFNIQLDTRVTS